MNKDNVVWVRRYGLSCGDLISTGSSVPPSAATGFVIDPVPVRGVSLSTWIIRQAAGDRVNTNHSVLMHEQYARCIHGLFHISSGFYKAVGYSKPVESK